MGNKDVRQWQYEHGERKLPEAPRAIGNWSLSGLIWRMNRRRKDRLNDAARRMNDGEESTR